MLETRIQPWDVKCPKCEQEKGLPCLRVRGGARISCHIQRWQLSKKNEKKAARAKKL